MMDWAGLAREVTQLGVFVSDYNRFVHKVFEGTFEDGEMKAGGQQQFCMYAMSERLRVRLEKDLQTLPNLTVGEVPNYETLRETGAIADCHRLMQRLSDDIHRKLFEPSAMNLKSSVVSLMHMNALEDAVRRRADEIDGTSDPLELAIEKLPENLRDKSLHVAILRQLNRSRERCTAGQLYLDLQEDTDRTENTVQRYLTTMKRLGCVFNLDDRKGYGLTGIHDSV
ncbi:MAG: hypothetical protein ACYTGL_19695 [Planctomycetota bacterium]|jgi:hypothetical protein